MNAKIVINFNLDQEHTLVKKILEDIHTPVKLGDILSESQELRVVDVYKTRRGIGGPLHVDIKLKPATRIPNKTY